MKKINMLCNIIILISITCVVLGQSLSVSDIDRLSNNQLDEIRNELQNQQTTLIEELNNNKFEDINVSSNNSISEDSTGPNYFGYDYFDSDINFFDNIRPDKEFILGPGDEIILSLWGETNLRREFTISKDGTIFYDSIGFINISGMNLSEAQKIITARLENIYSTLKSEINGTQLSLSLGDLKSINVFFSGETNSPGINLLHPSTDLFSAIAQTGIKNTGSLRNIELIRDGLIIETVDFYSFFLKGNNTFSDLRILDGDIINIPIVSKRVLVQGEVTRSGYFELLEDDTFSDLNYFFGGFTALSSTNGIIKRIASFEERISDDFAFNSFSIALNNKDISYDLKNGDEINILKIDSVSLDVTVIGQVKKPGDYPASKNLKEVLDLAGGFKDPNFVNSINKDKIIISRLDENNYYGKEFTISYEEADNFSLKPNDKILVYQNSNYNNDMSYTISGEILFPGTYVMNNQLSLSDAIRIAGGITENGNIDNISVSRMVNGEPQQILNISPDYKISSGNSIIINAVQDLIFVQGNVYSPGPVAIDRRSISVNQAINLAGGLKPYSLKRRIYVKKQNGETDSVGLTTRRLKRVNVGDTIVVPENPNGGDFDVTSFTADILAVLTNLAAILVLVDNND